MKHTIEIHDYTKVSDYGVETGIYVFDKTQNKKLSSCIVNFDKSVEMYASVESGHTKDEDVVYKTFEAENEDEVVDYIGELAYDSWIEKKLIYVDWED